LSRNSNRVEIRRIAACIAAAWLCVLVIPSAATATERALSFAVAGVVAKILVTPGDSIAAGAPLAVLDKTVFEARRKALVAAHAAATAELAVARQRHVYAEEQFDALAISKMELDEAAIALANAEAKAEKTGARLLAVTWRAERATLRAPVAAKVVKVPGYAGMVVNPRVEIAPVVVLEMP